LARTLVEQGVAVTLVDDLSRRNVDRLESELPAEVVFVEHDLTLPLPVEIAEQRYSHVFHLAAVVGVRRVTTAPEEVLRTNLLSTVNVLDWCARLRPDAFFLSSTSEIADGARDLIGQSAIPYEERPVVFTRPMLARSAYAVSKLSCELLVTHYATRWGFRARIGRYHNVYGPRMGYQHVIPELMQRAHARVDPFPVWAVDHSRAFCYVDDAVSATLALMSLDDLRPVTVDIGNDAENIKIGELAGVILNMAGHRPRIEPRPAPEGSPPLRGPDLQRMRELVDWSPQVSLKEGLMRTWSWYAAELDRRQVPR
jgi:UDP-glucose 4-epimerase/UDP-glucuronate decarboxylase